MTTKLLCRAPLPLLPESTFLGDSTNYGYDHLDMLEYGRKCFDAALALPVQTTQGLLTVAWLIDPGMGSGRDRLQLQEPDSLQYADLALRQGNAVPLCRVSDAQAIALPVQPTPESK